jgi:hypothetical protein
MVYPVINHLMLLFNYSWIKISLDILKRPKTGSSVRIWDRKGFEFFCRPPVTERGFEIKGKLKNSRMFRDYRSYNEKTVRFKLKTLKVVNESRAQ